MGLFAGLRKWAGRTRGRKSSKGRGSKRALKFRVCRFEEIEARQLLSITLPIPAPPPPIEVGCVEYQFPDSSGDDVSGNEFTVTFNGGARAPR